MLYKTAHCVAAIKVQRTRWEKSGAHAAVFSSGAVARLLDSFVCVPYLAVYRNGSMSRNGKIGEKRTDDGWMDGETDRHIDRWKDEVI